MIRLCLSESNGVEMVAKDGNYANSDAVIDLSCHRPCFITRSLVPRKRCRDIDTPHNLANASRWRRKEFPPETNPRRIILITGTNNLRERRCKPCEIFGGISAISKDLMALWPEATLFIMQLLPRGPDYIFRAIDRTSINRMISSSVEDATFTTIDEDAITCD